MASKVCVEAVRLCFVRFGVLLCVVKGKGFTVKVKLCVVYGLGLR